MDYIRIKALIPDNIYYLINNYLTGKMAKFKQITHEINYKKYKLTLEFLEEISSIGGEIKELSMRVYIYENDIEIHKSAYLVGNNYDLFKILNIVVDNVSGRKKVFLIKTTINDTKTIEHAKNILKAIDKSVSDNDYVRNYFLYADLSNIRELMDVCYLLMANSSMIRYHDTFKEFILNKLDYYGYKKTDNKEYNLDMFMFYNMKNTKEIINLMIGRIIFDINRFDGKGKCLRGDIETSDEIHNIAFETYETFIDCLYKEGLLIS